MYTGNPHQDRNPFATKWRDRINTDSRPPFHGGGAIPLPKDTMPREPWTGRFGPLAELSQKQKDFMGSPYNTPAFGVSKEDLWDKTKGMEKKGFFGWGAQEPTTTQEFNDYYKQLEQGTTGNWLAMAGKKKGPLATVPGSVVAPNVPEHTGFSDDLFKQDPHRTYNHGYRYNNYGLQPLYFG